MPDPPTRLRAELQEARAGGITFGQAWPKATRTTLAHVNKRDRANWRVAFAGTRAAWRCAYDHTPGPGLSRELLD